MGTAFIASSDLTEVPDGHKKKVVASDGSDTVYSTVYDVMNQRAFGDIPFVGDMALRAEKSPTLSRRSAPRARLCGTSAWKPSRYSGIEFPGYSTVSQFSFDWALAGS
jgi:hypothetical protein